MRPANTIILAAILSAIPVANAATQPVFQGNNMPVITVKPESSTGLDAIFVVSDTRGVEITYTSPNTVTWQTFGPGGGSSVDDITPQRQGDTTSLTLSDSDTGLIITDNGRPSYYWIVNYANHPCRFEDLDFSPEQDCGTTSLDFNGEAERITYYTINGAPRTLSRDIQLTYDTLVWDEATESYILSPAITSLEYLSATIHTTAPLCDTQFTLTGDSFMTQWGEQQQIQTTTLVTQAVEAHCTATQTERDADNEQTVDGATLGGSAPAEITFSAAVTDAVVFREWQFATDPEFEHIDIRINQDETDYTFREQGTTYVRFTAANAAGTCEYYSDTYTVTISESALRCPNAFSPGASEGVNDIWKVSYKSIISFECHIFNRWGVQVSHFTDPADGWDGKYNGRLVPSGVYYYVIKARGSDGKNYNLSGDINIINYDNNNTTSDSDLE